MTLELSLHLRAPTVIADGPILLSLELKNTGPVDTTVPASDGSSPFEYSVYSGDGSRQLEAASAAARRRADPWLADTPAIPRGERTLPPGNEAAYEDDLLSLLTARLEPGTYLLQASYRSKAGEVCTSPRVALEIATSKPEAIAQDIDAANGRIVIAEWHRDADRSTLLRGSQSGLSPLGQFFDLATLEATEPVRQCALSLNAAYGILDAWRWLAWLDSTNLRAGVAHENRWIYPTKPISLDLEAPSLLPYGYTLGDASAVFVVAGRRGGQAHLRLVRIPPGDDAEPGWTDIPLDKAPDAAPSATCVWTADGPPELILSWILEISGATLILFGRVSALTGEVLSPPKGVFVTLRAVPAVSVPPAIGPEERRRAQVLLTPASPDSSQLTHVTFDMADPEAQTALQLPSLPAFAAGGVDRWVLPSEPLLGAPVLAVAGPEIWASGSSTWTRLATGDVEASSVRLWAFSPARWICSWFDRSRGYQWQRLRNDER